MKKRKKLGTYLSGGPKRLKFGDVISGTGEAAELEAARKEIYQSMSEADAKELGKHEQWKKYNKSNDTQKFRDAADAYEAKQKKKREAEKRKAANESPRARKQNQAQGSGGKDRQGNVTPTPDRRTGKSGSNSDQKRAPKAPKVERLEGRKATTLPTNRPEQKLQRPSTPQKPSESASSEKSGRRTRAERITDRAEKRAGKIKDRRQRKANKAKRRDNIKAAKQAGKQMIREARGKAKNGTMRYEKGDFGQLSVKAGIDDNPKATAADRIAGAQMSEKEKAQGGRFRRAGRPRRAGRGRRNRQGRTPSNRGVFNFSQRRQNNRTNRGQRRFNRGAGSCGPGGCGAYD